MNDLDSQLIVKVFYNNKYFELEPITEIDLEEIKKKIKEKINYEENDIYNINLFYIDEDCDKILMIDSEELMEYSKEIDSSKYVINLTLEINKKIKNIEEKESNQSFNNNNANNNKINNFNKISNNSINEINNMIEENNKNESNKLISKLRNEIEYLKNYYKDRIKNIILYYEKILRENYKKSNGNINENYLKGREEHINYNINNKIGYDESKGNEKIKKNYTFNESRKQSDSNESLTIEEEISINNQKIKENEKAYNLDKIEYINNKCKICENKCKNVIFKCILCDNYFICNLCYTRNSIKNPLHRHFVFFEIKYPPEVIIQIREKEQEKIKFNKIISSFYSLLNSVFFDKNGNLTTKPFDESKVSNLKKICDEMVSLKAPPLEYYLEYQNTFINVQLKKLDEESKVIIKNKILKFLNILTKNVFE